METQKIVNLLNGSDNENSKIHKWYVIDSKSKGNYSHENPIKFLTSSLESNLCDYSDAYILVTGNITVTRTIVGDPVQRKQCCKLMQKFMYQLLLYQQKTMQNYQNY